MIPQEDSSAFGSSEAGDGLAKVVTQDRSTQAAAVTTFSVLRAQVNQDVLACLCRQAESVNLRFLAKPSLAAKAAIFVQMVPFSQGMKSRGSGRQPAALGM